MLALGPSLTEPSLSPGNDLDFLIAHLPVLGISSEDGIYKHNSYPECKKNNLLMFLSYNQFKIFIYLICICVHVCLGVLWGCGSCFPLWAYGDARTTFWSWFSSTLMVLGIQLRLPDLVTNAFTWRHGISHGNVLLEN